MEIISNNKRSPQKYEAAQRFPTLIINQNIKYHVTLKTGVMMLKINRCITGINYILKYIKIENCYFKLQ